MKRKKEGNKEEGKKKEGKDAMNNGEREKERVRREEIR